MPAGQYLATGFMYLNLGCHMMFVLKNRLKAQGIPADKTIKIIEDLVQAIFKTRFVEGVLTPQEPMAVVALREVFRKQAHSSIMKLDNASMEKLLFLIIMTLKKEFFLLSSPLELYSVTKGNLITLSINVQGTSAEKTVENVLQLFTKRAAGMSFMEYHQLRQYVLSAMEAFQTKVVNFAEAGLQNDRGKLIFKQRNAHNQQPLTSGVTSFPSQPTTFLSLGTWQQWKTSLVVDHVREYQKQSQRRQARSELQQLGKEKNLNDLFGGFNSQADFQVRLELFDYGQSQTLPKASSSTLRQQSSKKEIKSESKQQSQKIRKLIEEKFSGVGEEDEGEIDLLDVMDNS